MTSRIETATIMVVDDIPANLRLLQDMLSARGYSVRAFPRGKMAIAAAMKHPPDLFLLDINMPELNGFEVCMRLKANEKLKDIPVLFISALSEIEDKIKAFSVGGVDYVTKPFQEEEVSARVNTHLRLRKMQIEMEMHNLRLESLVKEGVRDISDSHFATLLVVSKLAEFRDDETGKHIERTQVFCKILAERLRRNSCYATNISDSFVENIFHAAPLHDIGKVGIPDSILLKPGKLTFEEFEVMKTHTLVGARALQSAQIKYPKNKFINLGIAIARSHHERWDGSGYPDGLAGEDIPLAGRIMALADIYDALRSKRPYKEPYSHEEAYRIILEGDGRTKPGHFDPHILEAFKAVGPDCANIWLRMEDSK